MSGKKEVLLAYKESILKELKYYELRIEEVRSQGNKSNVYHDVDSSDSESELLLNIDVGPSITQLKQQQLILKTCLQATQELTNLQISQSEVNILMEVPEFQGEPPVLEDGTWREVTAECRVDLVPFTIAFFVHQPTRLFSSPSYRGLHVAATKTAHEAELNKSILPTIWKPSDAVEVLRSYAAAHRSRRTTLARLAEKYAGSLHMEPMADGGYLMKCANLLEVMWTLQNKWSPVAPFHHRMKFDLEYMDESYIKIITQTHRQLADPSIETDERTYLLSKIISTCLEAQGPTQELYESMSSDPDTAQNFRKRRTTLDQEPDMPVVRGRKDREIMAPPKSLPKRAKPKQNTVESRKSRKEPEECAVGAKKSKNNDGGEKLCNKKDSAVDDEAEKENIVSNDGNVNKKSVENGVSKNVDNKKAGENVFDKNKVSNTQGLAKTSPNNDGNINNDVSNAISKNTNKKNIKDTETEKIKKVKGAISDKENTQKLVSEKNNVKKDAHDKKGNKVKAVANVAKSNDNKKSDKENINNDKEKQVIKEKDANTKQKTTDSTSKNNKINIGVKDKENVESIKASDSKKSPNSEQNKNDEKIKQTNGVISSKKGKEDTAKQANNVASSKKNNKENAKQVKSVEKSKKNTVENVKKSDSGVSSKKNENVKQSNNVASANKNTLENVKPNSAASKKNNENPKNVNDAVSAKKNNNINSKQGKDVASSKKSTADKPKQMTQAGSIKKKDNEIDKQTNDGVAKAKEINAINKAVNKISNKENNVNKAKKIDCVEDAVEKAPQKSNSAVKRKSNLADTADKENDVAKAKKPKLSKAETVNNKHHNKNKPMTLKNPSSVEKKTVPNKPKNVTGTLKIKARSAEKVSNVGDISKLSSDKTSKLPVKKMESVVNLKKNPLRISPRKLPSNFKPAKSNQQKISTKITSIPRLMKKPAPKT